MSDAVFGVVPELEPVFCDVFLEGFVHIVGMTVQRHVVVTLQFFESVPMPCPR